MADAAQRVLLNEFKALSKETWTNIELLNDNVFEWSVALIVLNPDSLYYGGYFKAKMTFPRNYPHSPPDFKFVRPLYHPNIYPDGRLCISILHPPGDDEMSGELAAEHIPAGFVMPTHESAWRRKEEEGDFEMSWEDSDVESFGGSESDFDEEMDSDFEGEEEEDEEDK
ncbi:hypothetical protein EKO04_007044 [Ascochyta lentis]|uniref:Ubiquitin-conjugating enzyme E2 2 n=1 Tax=Ascochyta lentis TaxID=205686 RepID=A0A8H7J1C8_9PLEO|nr:hypothetical protein EKO04_007044 [Ascochyta lentis]